MAVPNIFGSATSAIPLSQLDQNFATAITLGNTAVYLGNTTTSLGNVTLTNVTISSGNVTVTGANVSGNLTFTGTGNRITGDFSNATVANRVAFQTSTANSATSIYILPNGTSSTSQFVAVNNSDPTNASVLQLQVNATDYQIRGGITGTGTYLPMTFYTGGSERMRVDTSGNVGIGTSSPGAKLDVRGSSTFLVNATNPTAWVSVDSGLTTGSMYNQWNTTSNVGISGTYTNHPYTFVTNNAERMRIDSSGNLLVGTTSSSGKTTITTSTTSQRALYVSQTAATSNEATPAARFTKSSATTTTGQVFIEFTVNSDAAGSGQINANGANAAAFGSFSDQRLKENITDLPPQLANIMALRTVEFDYIESEGGGHQIGFIAQEVQQVYPDLVGERADGMLTLTDLNKNDARLIKCIQEQQALITALTARITALESN